MQINSINLGTENKDVSTMITPSKIYPLATNLLIFLPPLDIQKYLSLASRDSSILVYLPWSRDLLHPGLGLYKSQALSKIIGPSHLTITTKSMLASWGGFTKDQWSLFLTWLLLPFHPSRKIFSLRWSIYLLGLLFTVYFQITHNCTITT